MNVYITYIKNHLLILSEHVHYSFGILTLKSVCHWRRAALHTQLQYTTYTSKHTDTQHNLNIHSLKRCPTMHVSILQYHVVTDFTVTQYYTNGSMKFWKTVLRWMFSTPRILVPLCIRWTQRLLCYWLCCPWISPCISTSQFFNLHALERIWSLSLHSNATSAHTTSHWNASSSATHTSCSTKCCAPTHGSTRSTSSAQTTSNLQRSIERLKEVVKQFGFSFYHETTIVCQILYITDEHSYSELNVDVTSIERFTNCIVKRYFNISAVDNATTDNQTGRWMQTLFNRWRAVLERPSIMAMEQNNCSSLIYSILI